MTKSTLSILAAIPFLFASVALAETAPAGSADHQHAIDPVAWHKKVCGEIYAHKAARLAYVEAKLDLTAAQRPAWDKFKAIKLDAAAKGRGACLEAAPKAEGHPTALEREARAEKFLAAKMQTLQATRPALQALYEALTPEQKTAFDHAGHHHGHHGFGGHEQGHGFGPSHHDGKAG